MKRIHDIYKNLTEIVTRFTFEADDELQMDHEQLYECRHSRR